MYGEDELLALSGIQHFAFCRRQWALIHLEQAWEENVLTVEGDFMHERAHDESLREHRGDTLIVRGLSVRSYEIGLVGVCDVVEFHQDRKGHPLAGEDGLWRSLPVEYKRGKSKIDDIDRLQLCAQAICLEEMFATDIGEGFLFYGETRSRERVAFDTALRTSVVDCSKAMHDMYKRRHTPNVKPFSACRSCSLHDVCLARTVSKVTVSHYLDAALKEVSHETSS